MEREAKRRSVISWRLIVGIGLSVSLIISAVLFINRPPTWPHNELAAGQKNVSYPLYYPQKLPQGFTYNQGSFKPSPITTTYSLTYDGDKKIYINAQPYPKEVVFKDFYDRVLQNKADVSSGEGKAVTGQIEKQAIGSLVTDKTWVIINTPLGIDGQDLTTIVSSLRKL